MGICIPLLYEVYRGYIDFAFSARMSVISALSWKTLPEWFLNQVQHKLSCMATEAWLDIR